MIIAAAFEAGVSYGCVRGTEILEHGCMIRGMSAMRKMFATLTQNVDEYSIPPNRGRDRLSTPMVVAPTFALPGSSQMFKPACASSLQPIVG